MSRATKPSPLSGATERRALRRKVILFCESFNDAAWLKCFSLIDPKLRESGKLDRETYVDSLREFKATYGEIQPWHIRLSLHLEAHTKTDPRPFAFVYMVWQDRSHEFHMFRERWVRDAGGWFTRVVGLVPNKAQASEL